MNDKAGIRKKDASGARTFLQPVTSAATWADLPLSEPQRETLRAMARDAGGRATDTGSRLASGALSRREGALAVFAASDRSSPLAAAAALASERNLKLYRIDLSAVVSKYIGETEKNLSAAFDSAERDGAILLFDEADALFGRRAEVRDSHDRYANVDIDFLRQRLSRFGGLAILATRHPEQLDDAIVRSARYRVDLPSGPQKDDDCGDE